MLSKGSPEAMRPLLDKSGLPSWYDAEYDRLARSGRRVVALAHRSLGPSGAEGGCRTLADTRCCPSTFVLSYSTQVCRCRSTLFIAFGCLVRPPPTDLLLHAAHTIRRHSLMASTRSDFYFWFLKRWFGRVVACDTATAHPSLCRFRPPPAGARSAMMALSRAEVEKDGTLTFDGFLSFHCKTRADSKRVVRIRTFQACDSA